MQVWTRARSTESEMEHALNVEHTEHGANGGFHSKSHKYGGHERVHRK